MFILNSTSIHRGNVSRFRLHREHPLFRHSRRRVIKRSRADASPRTFLSRPRHTRGWPRLQTSHMHGHHRLPGLPPPEAGCSVLPLGLRDTPWPPANAATNFQRSRMPRHLTRILTRSCHLCDRMIIVVKNPQRTTVKCGSLSPTVSSAKEGETPMKSSLSVRRRLGGERCGEQEWFKTAARPWRPQSELLQSALQAPGDNESPRPAVIKRERERMSFILKLRSVFRRRRANANLASAPALIWAAAARHSCHPARASLRPVRRHHQRPR